MSDEFEHGWTKLPHAILSSTAARCLSLASRAVLMDWIQAWYMHTENGLKPKPIQFGWTQCTTPCDRNTWEARRRDLIAKGFIAPYGARYAGMYIASNTWRTYTPTSEESASLERHDSAREVRRTYTAARRQGPSAAGNSRRGPRREIAAASDDIRGGEKPPLAAGNSRRGPRREIAADTKTRQDNPHLPPPKAPCNSHQPPERSAIIDGVEVQVWPPPIEATQSLWAFASWTQGVAQAWSDDETTAAQPMLLRLQHARGLHSEADILDLAARRYAADSDEIAFIRTISTALGDLTDRGINRVRTVYNASGPDAVLRAAAGLCAEPGISAEKRMKWLAYRAQIEETGAHV